MTRLRDLAKLIRTKNAGPFQLTVDVMFDEKEPYELVRSKGILNEARIAELYQVPVDAVKVYHYHPAYAIKVTIPRPVTSGDTLDTDVFGGQQYGPLVNLEIDGPTTGEGGDSQMDGRESRVRELFPEVKDINSSSLGDQVIALWHEAWSKSEWNDLADIPKNDRLSDVSLVAHVRGVTQAARAIARVAVDLYDGIEIDFDLLTAGALLHDLSKPLENSPTGKTEVGRLFPHAHLAAHMARRAGLSEELIHIIVTHSRNSSTMPPSTYEGLIVHYADYCDSDILNVRYDKKILLTF